MQALGEQRGSEAAIATSVIHVTQGGCLYRHAGALSVEVAPALDEPLELCSSWATSPASTEQRARSRLELPRGRLWGRRPAGVAGKAGL